MERKSWDQYWIDIAEQIASRATCLRRKYGAVIVKDNRLISTGYCGAPMGELDCLHLGVCLRNEAGAAKGERYDLCRSVHAEMNAIIRASYHEMVGATIYIAGVYAEEESPCDGDPCNMCLRIIKNAKIKRVVYRREDNGLSEKL